MRVLVIDDLFRGWGPNKVFTAFSDTIDSATLIFNVQNLNNFLTPNYTYTTRNKACLIPKKFHVSASGKYYKAHWLLREDLDYMIENAF